jgi:hypothetical protein
VKRAVAIAFAAAAACGDDAVELAPGSESTGASDSTTNGGEAGTSSSTEDDATSSSNESTAGDSTGDAPACVSQWQSEPVVHANVWEPPAPRLSFFGGLAMGDGHSIFAVQMSRPKDPPVDYDVFTTRYRLDGTVRWIDEFGGLDLDDIPLGIAVDGDNHSYAVVRDHLSETISEGWTFIDSRIVVLAFDENGGHRWLWELESQPTNPDWPSDDRDARIAVDRDGHVHVAVTSDVNTGNTHPPEIVLVELDAWGNTLRHDVYVGEWSWGWRGFWFGIAADGSSRWMTPADFGTSSGGRIYAQTDDTEPTEIAAFGGEDFTVAGLAIGPDDEMVAVGGRSGGLGFVRAFASDGTPTFVNDGAGIPPTIGAVTIDCDGTILVAGTSTDDLELAALSPEGDTLWRMKVTPSVALESVAADHLALAPDGTALAVGGWARLLTDDPSLAPGLVTLVPR